LPAGNRPLLFVSSSPRNGETGVSLNPRIRTTFSLNVASEVAHNRSQIRLFRGSTRVPIIVSARSGFTNRRNLFIRPRNPLLPDTEYRLVLLPGLRARNGNTLGETVIIRFRTRRSMTPQE